MDEDRTAPAREEPTDVLCGQVMKGSRAGVGQSVGGGCDGHWASLEERAPLAQPAPPPPLVWVPLGVLPWAFGLVVMGCV